MESSFAYLMKSFSCTPNGHLLTKDLQRHSRPTRLVSLNLLFGESGGGGTTANRICKFTQEKMGKFIISGAVTVLLHVFLHSYRGEEVGWHHKSAGSARENRDISPCCEHPSGFSRARKLGTSNY